MYDETVQVKIDIRDLRKRGNTEIPFVEVSLNLDEKMNSEEKLYVRVFNINNNVVVVVSYYLTHINNGFLVPSYFWRNSKICFEL